MSATVPNRPTVSKSANLDDYKAWVREYIEARAKNDTCYPHHKEDYPLVVDCPLCDGPAMIAPLSMGDAPSWDCKLAYVPGHSIRLEGTDLIATDHRNGGTATAPAPWL